MERWQQIDALFQEALHRPAAEREDYLRAACGSDAALYREVASLVAQHADGATGDAWAADAALRLLSDTTGLKPGDRLGPYEIQSFVAAGGMGEVYKAHDTRLERAVAVKRLVGPHSDRFQHEARAIAALNHPHICQVYDVGPDYLVLEYIEGQPPQGPLPVERALRLARQVASALEAAHARGILHRDLKPANILVTASGDVKLLDFGLAKRVTADADVTRTATGLVLGTAAYMSPEQADGRPLDGRSDVFSFGAVLYELLSGRRPFGGASTAQVLSAVLRDAPPPLQTGLPALDRLVTQCLAKDAGQRPQTMHEVTATLDELVRGQTEAQPREPRPSIAVLPFADMSAAQDQEWFGDGLAEEIINALSQIPGLRVIARTSAFAFKRKEEDIRRIADVLGVVHVLEGSVRKAGERIRVTAQLIAAADGSHLWSERYDRDLQDVFAIQDDIARAITSALKVQLSARFSTRHRRTPKIEAYEAFLKARFHWSKMTPDSIRLCRESLERAIAIDPMFALAYTGYVSCYIFTSGAGLGASRQTEAVRAVEAATKALELEPNLAEAHAALGAIAGFGQYDWIEAERHFNAASASPLWSTEVRTYYGYHLMVTGRVRKAVAFLERNVDEDPLNFLQHVNLANMLESAGEFHRAADEYALALELNENFWPAYEGLAASLAGRGELAAALTHAERAYALAPWTSSTAGLLAGLLRRSGDSVRSTHVSQAFGDGTSRGAPLGFAYMYAMSGETDRAAEWAEKAISPDQKDLRILLFLYLAPGRVWRSSARWPRVAKKLNLDDLSGLTRSATP